MCSLIRNAIKLATEFAHENPGIKYTVDPSGTVTIQTLPVTLVEEDYQSTEIESQAENFQEEEEEEGDSPAVYRKYRPRAKSDPAFDSLSDKEKNLYIMTAKCADDVCLQCIHYMIQMGKRPNGFGFYAYDVMKKNPYFDGIEKKRLRSRVHHYSRKLNASK